VYDSEGAIQGTKEFSPVNKIAVFVPKNPWKPDTQINVEILTEGVEFEDGFNCYTKYSFSFTTCSLSERKIFFEHEGKVCSSLSLSLEPMTMTYA